MRLTGFMDANIGAPGGTNFFGDPGGDGAHFEANFAVVPGETLRVGVGGQGGHAVLTGAHQVRVGDRTLEAPRIFLNAGGRAAMPSPPVRTATV